MDTQYEDILNIQNDKQFDHKLLIKSVLYIVGIYSNSDTVKTIITMLIVHQLYSSYGNKLSIKNILKLAMSLID